MRFPAIEITLEACVKEPTRPYKTV
uniref:Uncharacterized protein n=1 Tax=Anguilla anguilla TaxID=7936 RepID=A0A0E9P9M2_ANGAN